MDRIIALTAGMIIACMLVSPAWAHPFIDQTDPPRLSNAPVGTGSVTVWYSEGVEIDYSSLEVFDSTGGRVDHADTSYHEGDASLHVTTMPLDEGVYTVSSSTLSKVDGHLVRDAFVFAVGAATIDAATAESVAPSAQVFVAEAAAKFPGLVGQTLVLGASVALILVWGTRRILGGADDAAEQTHHSRFMALVGAGAIIVLGSDIFMLAAHASLLGTPVLEALGTTFGTTVLVRTAITIALIAAWFVADRKSRVTPKWGAVFAAFGLLLAATFTAVGHGAASEHAAAVGLDYAHNIIAGVWVGGIAYLLFVMLPYASRMGKKADPAALALVPAFSAIFVACVGAAAVTGPLLLWLLEDSVSMVVGSTYGAILIAKLGLGSAMIAAGAYNLRVGRYKKGAPVIRRLKRSLRIEFALGIALLATVALLTNTTLPGGEVQAAGPETPTPGLDTVLYSSGAAFDLTIWPLAAGTNTLAVSVSDPEGRALGDLEGVGVTVTSVGRNIAPLKVDLDAAGDGTYAGELTLGFWGEWEIGVEAVRLQNANESAATRQLVKPQLADLSFGITEYDLPPGASPLHIIHDNAGTIWLSDPAAPRLWSFETATAEFAEHTFDGAGSVVLDIDGSGRVWFTDIQSAAIGSFDPDTGEFSLVGIPESLWETDGAPIPVWIHAAGDGLIWTSVPNKNSVLEYDPGSAEFEVHAAPAPGSAPFAITEDADGDIWFTGQNSGGIARIDPATGEIKEVTPDPPLEGPETISFDNDGRAWISEHRQGGGITRIDPATADSIHVAAPYPEALANSASFDRHQNVWFALHTIDLLAVYDPDSGALAEVAIPTEESWVQFTASDDDGNIWFAEQRAAKLGLVQITDPTLGSYAPPSEPVELSLAQLAAPLIGGVVIGASLLVVRALGKRRELLAGFEG